MILIIITWFVLWIAFLWMTSKLPEKFGWWCIGIMITLIIYLPVTIAISKINKSCPPQIICPPISQINWEQKYNEEIKRYLDDLVKSYRKQEEVFKKYPRVRKYFNAR